MPYTPPYDTNSDAGYGRISNRFHSSRQAGKAYPYVEVEEIEEYAQLRANNRFYDQDKPIPIIDKNNLPEKHYEREAYEINNGLSTEEIFTIN